MQFPELMPPYDEALHQAVDFILGRFDVLGIIASGTIIRGNPKPTSDLDMYVIIAQTQRQRLQRWFNGVPAEIFVNPASKVQEYFVEDSNSGRPITAHMLATGFVILERDEIVGKLQEQAREVLEAPPALTDDELRPIRYTAALQYEDALDMIDDPATATMILGQAVHSMLHVAFRQAGRWLPREKELLTALNDLDPKLAAWVQEFYATPTFERRLQLAEQIAKATIKETGFFEWESKLEDV
jgi:predicted nucleotidyltransferase